MPITIHSPYSGRPVKVRDGDIGRALRDEENRVFYVVPRRDGNGYYAALTRKGSDKDEQRYEEMLAKGQTAKEVGAERSKAQVHDATGPGRPGTRRRAVYLVIIVLVLAALAWFVLGRFYPGSSSPMQPAPAVAPAASVSPLPSPPRQVSRQGREGAQGSEARFLQVQVVEKNSEKASVKSGAILFCLPLRSFAPLRDTCLGRVTLNAPAAKLAA